MGTKKYTFYADTHEGAPHSKKLYSKLIGEVNVEDTFLLGDIIDIANVKKRKLKTWRKRIELLSEKFGDAYLKGNHECMDPVSYYRVFDNILCCHGHTIFWEKAKTKKWEKKKGGKGRLSRMFYAAYKVGIVGANRGKPGTQKLSVAQKEKCYELCMKHDCKTIVFGHTHDQCDITYRGIRIINVPRGMTVKEI